MVHGDRVPGRVRARGGDRVSALLAVRVPVPALGAGWLAVCVVETGCWAPALRGCCAARGGDRVPVLCAGCVL